MVSVRALTLANHFGINLCSTCLSVLEFLKYYTTSTLAHYETVAACAERTACALWVIVACGESLHSVEASYSACAYCSLSATRNDNIGFAKTYQVESVCNGVA